MLEKEILTQKLLVDFTNKQVTHETEFEILN